MGDGVQIVRYLLHPHYTTVNMAQAVGNGVPKADRRMECPLMSFIGGHAVALNAASRSKSSLEPQAEWELIERCDPRIFPTRGDVDEDVRLSFTGQAGRLSSSGSSQRFRAWWRISRNAVSGAGRCTPLSCRLKGPGIVAVAVAVVWW